MTRAIHKLRTRASAEVVPTPRAADEPVIVAADGEVPPSIVSGTVATEPPGPRRPRAPRNPGALAFGIFRQFSLPVLLVVSILIYATWGGDVSRTFNSSANWQFIAANQAVSGVLTLGILLTLVSGNFDLSIGNIAGLSSVMTAAAYSHWHFPLVLGLLFGVALGAAVGGMNGFLSTTLRVDPFIITLGTASIILGFLDWYTKGQSAA